ncbi:hypothetical protein PMIN01_10010 [Paraphaeosphaeria minitans]|uniref:Uncharacterized protein n=1 Tax=Paraphaeosphaeria minitans TaxID=565426 RepID=A0A9P6GAC4_9PLEO|nr:hypothetical protein PMIN01_10010 [Paraphaeosphaeria minitans]
MPSRANWRARRVVSGVWSGGPAAPTRSPAANSDAHGRPFCHQTSTLDAGPGTMHSVPMRYALSGPGAAKVISAQVAGDCAAPTSLPRHSPIPIPAAATFSLHPGIGVSISALKSTTTTTTTTTTTPIFLPTKPALHNGSQAPVRVPVAVRAEWQGPGSSMTRCLTVACQPANPSLVLPARSCSLYIKEAWQGTWGPRQLSFSHKPNPDASFLVGLSSLVERCVYNHLRVCLSVITSNFSRHFHCTLHIHIRRRHAHTTHTYTTSPITTFRNIKTIFATSSHPNPPHNVHTFHSYTYHVTNITASMGRGGYN